MEYGLGWARPEQMLACGKITPGSRPAGVIRGHLDEEAAVWQVGWAELGNSPVRLCETWGWSTTDQAAASTGVCLIWCR